MQENKKRLCRLASETVLLLAEVTLNLALLDELEVLLCREKERLVSGIPSQSESDQIHSERARVSIESICSRIETGSGKRTSKTYL
jgi:hypothetical protein